MAYTGVPDGLFLNSDEEDELDFGDLDTVNWESIANALSKHPDCDDQFVPTLSSITSTPHDTNSYQSQYEDASHIPPPEIANQTTQETVSLVTAPVGSIKPISNPSGATKSPTKGVLRDSKSSSGSPSPSKKPVVFNIDSQTGEDTRVRLSGDTATDQSNRSVFNEKRGRGLGGFKARTSRDRRRHHSGGRGRTHRSLVGTTGSRNEDQLKMMEMGEELLVAIARGKTEEIQRILDGGYEVNSILKSGWTALMHACDSANDTAVEILLTRGANPNTQSDMYTALMAVCAAGRPSRKEQLVNCAKLLINKGARVHVHDKHHMTALLYACQTGQSGLAELLVSVSADVNKQDTRGWTPLMYAAERNNLHLVKILMKSNADPHLASNLGDTPSTIAYGNGYTDISDYLDGIMSGSLELNDEGVTQKVPPHPLLMNFNQRGSADSGRHADKKYSGAFQTTSSSNGPIKSVESVCYGDLDLFLLGQKLGDLIPLFRKHKVTFGDLISMTDKDLEQIGVQQVGARKKILSAIAELHSKEWIMPANHLPIDKPISALEAAVILSHLSSHANYIKGTVSYLLNHVTSNPDMLGVHLVPTETEQVTNELSKATTAMSSLQDEMAGLQSEMNTALSVHRQTDQSDERSHGLVTRRRVLKLAAVVGGLTVVSIATAYVGKSFLKHFTTS